MSDDEIHLHPSRPPTEAEHRFAQGIVGMLRFMRDFASFAAVIASIAAFVWGVFVLVSGGASDPTAMTGLCILWALFVVAVGVLFLLVYTVEWVKWASGTKPVESEQEKDWRDFDQ